MQSIGEDTLLNLRLESLKQHASTFLTILSRTEISDLYGVTDGKAVGTYVEHRFNEYLSEKFSYEQGNSASGIDFPALEVDLKVTSHKQPQSSSPFRSASQKVYGLGYHLMVFVYDKQDDTQKDMAHLNFLDAIFIHKNHTADYQTTSGLLNIIKNNGNIDDVDAFLLERNLPLDEIGRSELAQRILQNPPELGYITISSVGNC